MEKDVNLSSHISIDETVGSGSEAYSEERFVGSMIAVQEMLSYLEEECGNDEDLRDTVTIACEGIFRTLYAIHHKCIN